MQILASNGRVSVLVAPEIAELSGVRDASSEADLRTALNAAGVEMNGADYLFFLPQAHKSRLRSSIDAGHVRRLHPGDAAAFATFEEAAPEADFSEAFVELGHWAVYGAFIEDALVAVGSAYPFRGDTLLADLGVVTLPHHGRQGHARAVIHALARHALAEGFEPQYRCQLDNAASAALATRSGFEAVGTWDVSVRADHHGSA